MISERLVEIPRELITPVLYLEMQYQGYTSVTLEDVMALSEHRKEIAARPKYGYKDDAGRYGLFSPAVNEAAFYIWRSKGTECGYIEERVEEYLDWVNRMSEYRSANSMLSSELLLEAFEKLDAFIAEKQGLQQSSNPVPHH